MSQNVRVRYEVDNAQLRNTGALLERLDRQIEENIRDTRQWSGAMADVGNSAREATPAINNASGATQKAGMSLSGIVKMAAGAWVTSKVIDFGKAMLSTAGSMESTKVAFSTMLGSQRQATSLLKEIEILSAKTPFEFPELANTSRQLISFGVGAKESVNIMAQLGDIASGTNSSIEELGFIMGKVKSQGKAATDDLNQFAQRGIPVFDELSKVLGVTPEQVRKLVEAGKVGFPEMTKVIGNLTGEGGKFFGMMEAQSETFEGKLSTFNDAWKALVRTMGNELLPIAKDALDWITNFIGGTTTLSGSLVAEQGELNALAGSLITATDEGEKNADSKKLQAFYIGQLQKEYPEFLKNLDTENLTTAQLRGSLKGLNEEYDKKIKLAVAQEFITAQQEAQAEAIKKQGKAMSDANKALFELKKAGRVMVDENLPLMEQMALAYSQVTQSAMSLENTGRAMAVSQTPLRYLFDTNAKVGTIYDKTLISLGNGLAAYNEGQKESALASELLNQAMSEMDKTMSSFGLTSQGVDELLNGTETTIKTLAAAADGNGSGGAAGSIKAMEEALKELNKQFDETGSSERRSGLRKEIDLLKEKIDLAKSGAGGKPELDDLSGKPELDDLAFLQDMSDGEDDVTKALLERIDAERAAEMFRKGAIDRWLADRNKIIEAERNLEAAIVANSSAMADQEPDASGWDKYADSIGKVTDIAGELSGILSGIFDLQDQRRTAAEEEEIRIAEEQIARKVAGAKDKEKAEADGDKRIAAIRERIEKEQQKRRKKSALVEAGIATALNITKALGTPPVPNFIAAGLAAAASAVQIATIAGAQFFKGGFTGDKGIHDVAGIVHGQEFVIPHGPTKRFRPLLEMMRDTPERVDAMLRGSVTAKVNTTRMEGLLRRNIRATKSISDALNKSRNTSARQGW